MKNLSIKFIFCLGVSILLVSAQTWNYSSQTTWPTCTTNPVTGAQTAPLNITSNQVPCGYYNNFNLSLNKVSYNASWNTSLGNVVFTPASGSIGTLYVDVPGLDTSFGPTTTTFTGQFIVFHNPAENVVNLTSSNPSTSTIEMQIYFTNSTGQYAILSVIFSLATTTWQKTNVGYTTALESIPSNTNGTANFNLPNIVTLINNNMNVFVYDGYFSVPYETGDTVPSSACQQAYWFVYGPTLWTDSTPFTNFSALFGAASTAAGVPNIAKSVGVTVNNNKTATNFNITNAGATNANIIRYCWGGYYQLSIPYNYGLWFAIVTTIIYFILTLWFEPLPVEDVEYRTNPWTHHPLYSIMTVGDNIFTRKSRTALLWVNIINVSMFTSIFYAQVGYGNSTTNIFLFGLYGNLCATGATYIHGYFLRRYYINKKLAIEQEVALSNLSSIDQQDKSKSGQYEQKIQAYDDKAQGSLFIFYFYVFLWMWGGNAIFIWQMSYLHAEVNNSLSNDWTASFFIALGLDWVVLDVIAAMLAHVEVFRNVFVNKGYIYDAEVNHWSYKNQKKIQ